MPNALRGPLNQTQIDHLELASTEIEPRTAKLFRSRSRPSVCRAGVAGAGRDPSIATAAGARVFRPFVARLRLGGSGDFAGLWTALLDGLSRHAARRRRHRRGPARSSALPAADAAIAHRLARGRQRQGGARPRRWMFYLPGLDYVAGPSVADAATFDRAAQEMVNKGTHASPQPDPRPALLDLHR